MIAQLAQAAQAAAQQAGAQMAAQAMAQAQGQGQQQQQQPGQPNQGGQPTMGTGEQANDQVMAALQEMGISLSDWSRLPGQLKDEILQAANDRAPEEYRTLIKRYFQEMAKRGLASNQPAQPKKK